MLLVPVSLLRTRSGRFAATCAAGAILAMVAGVALHLRVPGFAQRQWRDEVSQASLDEIPALLDHLAAQDEVGMAVLVELLDDDRPNVASAAERALRSQMHAWRLLPVDEASRKVAALARLLAEYGDTFRSRGRYAAAQLASEIIDWPLDESATDIAAVLAHCETILRDAPAHGDELMQVAHRGNANSLPATPIALPIVTPSTTQYSASPLGIAGALPGGGLPVEPGENVPPPRPTTTYAPSNSTITPDEQRPAPRPIPPDEFYSPLAIPLALADQMSNDRNRQTPSHTNTPSSIHPRATADLSALNDVELMRALQDAAGRESAEDELRRRGFDTLRLEVARRLTHPDPNTRKELANALPQIAGVDAQPWLTELAADPHPDVRRVAIAILATNGDEQTNRWLREIRHDESDPRVAELIDGILEKRR